MRNYRCKSFFSIIFFLFIILGTVPTSGYSDIIPPDITCPIDRIIECDTITLPNITGFPVVTDDTDPDPNITFSDIVSSGSCSSEFIINRIWTASDASGNSNSCEQTIELADFRPPDIQCNTPVTITRKNTPIPFTATATDNCVVDPSVEIIDYDCFAVSNTGNRIDRLRQCVIAVSGSTITILDSHGANYNIRWTVRANEDCGNVAESTCTVAVVRKGKP
jgi:hypothetical protein